LVSNIGFDEEATHTSEVNHELSNNKVSAISNIIHPEIYINDSADTFTRTKIFNIKSENIFLKLKRLFNFIN